MKKNNISKLKKKIILFVNKYIMNFLKKFDSFGVVYNLNVNNYDKQYRSTLGGLLTISVYILTLIYFIYKIMLW